MGDDNAEPEPAWWKDYQQKFNAWLSDDVGLSPELLKTLQEKDDDWSFIIKTHAILEVALNHMLIGKLNHGEISKVIPYLNVHGRSGKIAWAQALGMLSDAQAKFIRLVTEMRKTLVHDIKHFEFNLLTYLQGLDKNRLEQWSSICVQASFPAHVPSHFYKLAPLIPRFAIFQGCTSIMTASFKARPNHAADLYRWHQMMGKESETPDESIPTE